MAAQEGLKYTYEGGVLLRNAANHFAPAKLLRRLLSARKREKQKDEAYRRQQARMLRSGFFDAAGRARIAKPLKINLKRLDADPFYLLFRPSDERALNTDSMEPERCIQAIIDNLIEMLRSGCFAAIGYDVLGVRAKSLISIPPAMLQRFTHINLGRSSISTDGLDYVGVRLVPLDAFDIPGEAPVQKGRTSTKEALMQKYNALFDNGTITPESSLTEVVTAIQHDWKAAPQDRTIRKHLREVHAANKSKAKTGNK